MDNLLGGGSGGGRQQLRINLDECENVTCKCGCDIYLTNMSRIKRIKGIQIGASVDQIQVLPLLVCKNCEKVLDVQKLQKEESVEEPSPIITRP